MKIRALSLIVMLIISNAIILFVTPVFADEQPQWPTSWVLADTDPNEGSVGPEHDYRDVHYASYSLNDNYVYFRLECYGYPNFSAHPDDSRYKWFIDIDDPHNMIWSGGKVVEADYLLFVEDTDNDGIGDVYLINDIDNNGNFDEWESYPDYWYNEIITDVNIANYSIVDKNLSLWIRLENISNPDFVYFTWSTDNENSNIDQAPTLDRSDTFSADLSKADVSIEKIDSDDPVHSGGYLSYTIYVENHGPHTALNVNVTDNLPSQVTFISADPAPSGNSGSTYWWNFAALSVGELKEITINVNVNSGFTGIIDNIAHVYNDTRDPIPDNNEDNEQTNIIYMADLGISKSASTSAVYPGEYLEYTLDITNNGPDAATNVKVSDNLPDKVTFNYAIPSPDSISGSVYRWDYSSIGSGGSIQIIINVTINDDETGTIINNANVTSDTFDPVAGNNADVNQVNIGSSADLSLTKTASTTDLVYVGDSITYTIIVTNNGPDVAENVIIYDDIPSEVSFVSSDPDFSGNSDSIYWWAIGSLDVYESAQIIINVTVNNVPAGTINNIAYVTSNTHDTTPDDNDDNIQINMGSSADLSITKTAEPDVVQPGGSLKYTIVVTNNGPDTAENVSVLDTLSDKITFISSYPEPSGNSSSSYWWNFSLLGAGQSEIIIINVTVNKNASGTIINIANVTSDTNDPNPGDESNEDEEETEIQKPPSPPSGGGGGGGGGGAVATDLLPTADPNGPYYGFIGEEIEFNGTGSYDNDEAGESIVQYDWKFFDGDNWHLDLGATPKYIYYEPGIYNVTLSVLDNEGSSSSKTTTVTIYQANLPPIINSITGETNGHQNISYSYNIDATDPDGDNITYNVNWGDGSGDISSALEDGIIYTANHIWNAPGDYTVTVYAEDEQGAQSNYETINVLIDIHYVKDIGYLIDYDSDGTYEKFYSNTTNKETASEKLDDGRYLINDDDDEAWDWVYDPETDTLEVYYYGEEADLTLWYILLILILICLIVLLLLLYKKRKKKETSSETSTGTQP